MTPCGPRACSVSRRPRRAIRRRHPVPGRPRPRLPACRAASSVSCPCQGDLPSPRPARADCAADQHVVQVAVRRRRARRRFSTPTVQAQKSRRTIVHCAPPTCCRFRSCTSSALDPAGTGRSMGCSYPKTIRCSAGFSSLQVPWSSRWTSGNRPSRRRYRAPLRGSASADAPPSGARASADSSSLHTGISARSADSKRLGCSMQPISSAIRRRRERRL